MNDAGDSLGRLDAWITRRDAAGWDPYDGLSSPFLSMTRGQRPRQAATQLVKRSPELLRRTLRVPQHRMTKTLALLAAGLGLATYLPRAAERRLALVDEIRARRGPAAWGYEFDVQTRWGFYPAGSPNAIVTAFACEVVVPQLSEPERRSIADWLTGPMWQGKFFRYVPGNDTLVHNANVLAARALHRLDPTHPAIEIAVGTTAEALPSGRLWPYGDSHGLAWVDNFHTAYVLDALLDVQHIAGVSDVIAAAADLYVATCFSAEGHPYYYASGSGPVDVHNVATALYTLGRLADAGLARETLISSCTTYARSLQREDGAFVAKRHGVPFMRWNQAHMHKALATVNR